MFIKEDEDLYPDLDYSPVAERTRRAIAAIERVRDQRRRAGPGLFAARHRRPRADRRPGPRRARGGRLGRDVQRDLRRRDGPDGPRGDQAAGQSAGDLRPQCRHRRQDPGHLARGDRLAGPARRHRFPPDGPAAARLALHPPVWRGVAGLGRGAHAADRRHQPDDDHPRRRARSGQHHPQSRRTWNRRGSPRTCCSSPARRSTRSRARTASPTRGSAWRRCSRRSRFIDRAS